MKNINRKFNLYENVEYIYIYNSCDKKLKKCKSEYKLW